MKLKIYFFILLILLPLAVLFIEIGLPDLQLRVWALEVLILLFIVLLFVFYRKVVKPIDTITSGMELIREQDFSSRLRLVGQHDADKLVQLFNRMMAQLKEERLRLREQNYFLDLLIKASPMGVVILNFDEEITDLNPAAMRFLGLSSVDTVKGKSLSMFASPLAEALAALELNQSETVRLSDSGIYKCSRLSFIDRGFNHPFYLIESVTREVNVAERKA